MLQYKLTVFLTLCILFSFVIENECYIGIVDFSTYRTVTNFADECVKWKHLKHMPMRRLKKLKRVSIGSSLEQRRKKKGSLGVILFNATVLIVQFEKLLNFSDPSIRLWGFTSLEELMEIRIASIGANGTIILFLWIKWNKFQKRLCYKVFKKVLRKL